MALSNVATACLSRSAINKAVPSSAWYSALFFRALTSFLKESAACFSLPVSSAIRPCRCKISGMCRCFLPIFCRAFSASENRPF